MSGDIAARRAGALARIREHIERRGQHVYVVAAGTVPRWAYTIGLTEAIGTELVLAGGASFGDDDVVEILNDIADALRSDPALRKLMVDGAGTFTLRAADASWVQDLLLGARDYYQRDVTALQVVPDAEHLTGDTPDLSQPWRADDQRAWRWLREPWELPVPSDSTAVTDLDALRGAPVLEAARWEEDQWELFSAPGDELPRERIRLVPLGTMLALDGTLAVVTHLRVGDGVVREDGGSEWSEWA
jgi:hypothetical protein